MDNTHIFEDAKNWVYEYPDGDTYKHQLYLYHMKLSLQPVCLPSMTRYFPVTFCSVKYMFYFYFLWNIILNLEAKITAKLLFVFVIGYCIYSLYVIKGKCICQNMFVIENGMQSSKL